MISSSQVELISPRARVGRNIVGHGCDKAISTAGHCLYITRSVCVIPQHSSKFADHDPETVIEFGANDPLRPDVDQLKRLLPRTKVVVIDKADHWTAITRPELIRGLRQFFDEHRGPSRK